MKYIICCELRMPLTGVSVGVFTFKNFHLKYLMAKNLARVSSRFGGSFKMKKITMARAIYYRLMFATGRITSLVSK